MKRIRRKKDLILHVYNRGNRKEEICLDKSDYMFLYNLFFYHLTLNSFDILTFCVMPNHYHLLLSQKGNVDLGVVMQRIGSRYTKYFNRKYNLSGHLFQGTYKYKNIISSDQLNIVSTYIENNLQKDRKELPYFFVNNDLISLCYLAFLESSIPK